MDRHQNGHVTGVPSPLAKVGSLLLPHVFAAASSAGVFRHDGNDSLNTRGYGLRIRPDHVRFSVVVCMAGQRVAKIGY